MRRLLPVLAFALAATGCATATVYGVVGDEDDLYTGTAIGYMTRSGTIELSNSRGNACKGDFAYDPGVRSGHGIIACDDGQRATIRFNGLSSDSGYGTGISSNGRRVAFTYGLSREQSLAYLGFKGAAIPGTVRAGSGNSPAEAPPRPGAKPTAPPGPATRVSTGTGFYINRQGHVLTNAHVVAKCREITVSRQGAAAVAASLVQADAANDIAVLIAPPSPVAASFRAGRPVRAGEAVVAFGFPLTGTLSSAGTVTNGSVSALAGLGHDSRYLQISVPVQPGNSGGPLLDGSGNVVGVITASIRPAAVARSTGTLPQNVNFALKADVARSFLEAAGVPADAAASGRELSVPDIGEKARAFSVLIDCKN